MWRLTASVAVICGALAAGTAAAQNPKLAIEVLSSRAELVSGGDALVRIAADAAPQVTVGGKDVSAALSRIRRAAGSAWSAGSRTATTRCSPRPAAKRGL